MKQRVFEIALIVALVVVAFALRSRQPGGETPETPETSEDFRRDGGYARTPYPAIAADAAATVSDFFDAASRGDDQAYLRLVSGQLRRSLEQTRSELGLEAFRAELRRSTSDIKGLATMPGDGARGGQMAVDVELVFADRNEHQRMLLARKGNGWVITSIEKARMVKPPIPYGTPVFEEPVHQTAD